MAFINGNYIKIDGNGNIVVQDIDNSTININTEYSKQINDFIEELHNDSKDIVNIMVLSSVSETMQAFCESDDMIIIEKYGSVIEEWKPFGDKTILEILQESAKSLKAEINVFFLKNLYNIEDDYSWAYLKYIKARTILIVDIFALYIRENKFIANVFNDYHIGGCIVISPEKTSEKLNIIKKLVFNHQEIYINDFAGKIGLIHIRKDNITKESKLKTEITNISHYFLNIELKKIRSKHNLNMNFDNFTI